LAASICEECNALMIKITSFWQRLFIIKKYEKNPLPQAQNLEGIICFYCFFQIKAGDNSGQVIQFD